MDHLIYDEVLIEEKRLTFSSSWIKTFVCVCNNTNNTIQKGLPSGAVTPLWPGKRTDDDDDDKGGKLCPIFDSSLQLRESTDELPSACS